MRRLFKIIIVSIMFIYIPAVYAIVNETEYTITYDANGGKFSNNTSTNIVNYIKKEDIKYSYTQNLDIDGQKISDYGDNWNNSNIVGTDRGDTSKAHVITIEGAKQILVDVIYSGEKYSTDHTCVWEGKHPDYNCKTQGSNQGNNHVLYGNGWSDRTINGKPVGRVSTTTITIDGDSVTFGFTSDSSDSGTGYGYYAMVYVDTPYTNTNYEDPTYNSRTRFDGWYKNERTLYADRVDINSLFETTTLYAKWLDVYTIEELLAGEKPEVGSLVIIGDQDFYVIGWEDDTHVKLFAKYGLDVGYGFDNPTYKQNSLVGSREDSTGKMFGSLEFSDTNYWLDDDNNFLEKYNRNNYPDLYNYVYDENSNVYPVIGKYVDYIRSLGVCSTGRLIDQAESFELGCQNFCRSCMMSGMLYSCYYSPSWLVEPRFYFTGNADNEYYNGIVLNNDTAGYGTYSYVRPVIIADVGTDCSIKKAEPITQNKYVKGVQEIIENPETGVFTHTLLTMVLLIVSILVYIKARRIDIFKNY